MEVVFFSGGGGKGHILKPCFFFSLNSEKHETRFKVLQKNFNSVFMLQPLYTTSLIYDV